MKECQCHWLSRITTFFFNFPSHLLRDCREWWNCHRRFEQHFRTTAALFQSVSNKLSVSCNAEANPKLDTQSQNTYCALLDPFKSIKDSSFELIGRERSSHSKSLDDETLADPPDLFDGRNVGRVGWPAFQQCDVLVSKPFSSTPQYGSWHHLVERSRRFPFVGGTQRSRCLPITRRTFQRSSCLDT